MHASARFFQSSGYLPAAAPPEPVEMDSDILVTLAALLCALICVVGLALVARCAWLRRSSSSPVQPPPPPNKGLKKKAIRALPRLSFRPGAAGAGLAECPICLSEFVEGDQIRVLPRCGHVFHVACVDMWLGSHSSCPSCRQVPVVVGAAAAARCRNCAAAAGSAAMAPAPVEATRVGAAPREGSEAAAEAGEAGDGYRFLP